MRYGFILLVSWAVCTEATTYYVTKAGNDANDGSQATPWLTVGKAADTILDGDRVIIGDGVYNENNDGLNNLKLNRSFTPKGVVFEAEHPHSGSTWYVTVTGNSGNCSNIFFSGAVGVTLKEVQLAPKAGSGNQHVLHLNSGNKKLRFLDCSITNPSTLASRQALEITGTGRSYSIEFIRCSFSAKGSNSMVMKTNTFILPAIDNMIFYECSISSIGGTECGLVDFADGMRGVTFETCTFVQSGKLSGRVISLGNDGASVQNNSCFGIKVRKCTIQSETDSHVVLVGGNVHGGTLDQCVITAPKGDYGIVIKCATGVTIRNNIILGANNGLISRASWDFEICHNLVSAITRGIVIDPYIGSAPMMGTGNLGEIYNNILILSSPLESNGIQLYAPAQVPNILIDYNCYWGTGKGIFNPIYVDGTSMTLPQAIEFWKTYGVETGRTSNDSHSIQADPQFSESTLTKPQLKATSPCINAGRPTPWEGTTTIGVWQPGPLRPARRQ